MRFANGSCGFALGCHLCRRRASSREQKLLQNGLCGCLLVRPQKTHLCIHLSPPFTNVVACTNMRVRMTAMPKCVVVPAIGEFG